MIEVLKIKKAPPRFLQKKAGLVLFFCFAICLLHAQKYSTHDSIVQLLCKTRWNCVSTVYLKKDAREKWDGGNFQSIRFDSTGMYSINGYKSGAWHFNGGKQLVLEPDSVSKARHFPSGKMTLVTLGEGQLILETQTAPGLTYRYFFAPPKNIPKRYYPYNYSQPFNDSVITSIEKLDWAFFIVDKDTIGPLIITHVAISTEGGYYHFRKEELAGLAPFYYRNSEEISGELFRRVTRID